MNPIEKLAKIVKSQQEERQRYKEAEDIKLERRRTIDNAPTPWRTEFYCKGCKKDFVRVADKIEISYTGFDSESIAFYEAKCPLNLHWCRRRITDKAHDPFYLESPAIQKAKMEMEIDMLQPDDPRFKKYWGDPYKKINEQREQQERAEWQNNKDKSTSGIIQS